VPGVSGPGLKSSCLGTASIDDETCAEIGGDTLDAFVVATTGPTLSGNILESTELSNNNRRNVKLLTLYGYQSLNRCRSTMMRAPVTNEEKKTASL
jgi:hypothetical protein